MFTSDTNPSTHIYYRRSQVMMIHDSETNIGPEMGAILSNWDFLYQPEWPFASNKIFEKPSKKISCTSWPLSLLRIWKKSLERMQSYGDASFLGKNGLLARTGIFTERLTSQFCFMYCCPLLYKIWRESLLYSRY